MNSKINLHRTIFIFALSAVFAISPTYLHPNKNLLQEPTLPSSLAIPLAKNGYKVYNLHSHSIIITRDIIFKEHIFPFTQPNFVTLPPNDTHSPVHPLPQFENSTVEDITPVVINNKFKTQNVSH